MTAPVDNPAAAARACLAEGRWPADWTDREAALAAPTLAVLDAMAAEVHGQPLLVSLPRLAVAVAAQANRGVVSHPMARQVVVHLAELGALQLVGQTQCCRVVVVL